MENKENLTNDILDKATDNNTSAAVEEFDSIADYYKDFSSDTVVMHEEIPKRTIITDPEAYASEGYTPVILKRRYNGNLIADIAFVAAALLVALAILMFSFYLGSLGAKDPVLVEDKYAQLLAESSKYNDLIKQISDINTEIEDLTRERDLKQAEYDALIAYRDGEGSISEQIAQLQSQLDTLNAENQKKQAEIDTLTSDISEKVSTIMNLPPGIYTVGENIAAGKYTVTGSGSVLISGSNGKVKLNTILTADGINVTLDDLDKIQLDTRAKFSPAS